MRGVDCGPVLKTLLDRGLVRMIGKKEEVGPADARTARRPSSCASSA